MIASDPLQSEDNDLSVAAASSNSSYSGEDLLMTEWRTEVTLFSSVLFKCNPTKYFPCLSSLHQSVTSCSHAHAEREAVMMVRDVV